MPVHVAGPVRKGSRQIVQRCVRCGHPLVIENAQIGGDVGFGLGSLVDEQGVCLDDVYAKLPPQQICSYNPRNKKRIVLD